MAKGSTKKHAKGRLDKFYHLAKEQGYRARSAFKLIQLNKKYSFLEKSKCVIDLCAAPGGWLQVCEKYMPKPNLIIGVDLEKIKPINGCITHVEDITTASCRSTLKKDLKTWKADVVLHDGAPNVGVSWAQDAFTQSELTLSACRLATDFLVKGGCFVTKVFRSKDYNKLMWVFNQLFDKVEATKPTASRNVSAEIFVVCRGYLAPKKIDPRLLDPKFAFREVDDLKDVETDQKKLKSKQGAVLNDLMHPEKRKRHRDGYEDEDYTLYKEADVGEFIKSDDFLAILARSSAISFGDDEFSQKCLDSNFTTEDIREYLKDLKVLGKKDFKQVIKWRDYVRIELGFVKKDKVVEETPVVEVEDMDIEDIIKEQKDKDDHRLKKLKKKQRERKAKILLKMSLGMETPLDIGVEQDAGILPEVDMGVDEEFGKKKKSKKQVESESESDDEVYNSDEELNRKIGRLDSEMDNMYAEFDRRRIERNPSMKVKKVKEASAAFEEWYGLQETEVVEKGPKNEYDSSSSESDNDEYDRSIDLPAADREKGLSANAKLFFDNPLFASIEEDVEEVDEKDDDGFGKSLFEEELKIQDSKNKNPKKKPLIAKKPSGAFEIVPVSQAAAFESEEEQESEVESELDIDSAQKYTMAKKLQSKSGRRDLVDDSFNRYTFNDPEQLPQWYIIFNKVYSR
jgi:AdoMet-dependent rRNA methyltransferase SPB1